MGEAKKAKRLKDPVYGYVEIPVDYMESIIDTAEFQRLRRIVQTSYSPLYSSAIHNRFVHSIGVFYLGSIVSRRIVIELQRKGIVTGEDEIQQIEKWAEIYRLACLLHDVGHAPFSHTGECFYKNAKFQSVELHKRLCDLVGSEQFRGEVPQQEAKSAAPHELMSVIIGLKKYGDYIGNSEEKEFFARCITGYRYENVDKDDYIVQIKNCLIGMLNSKVIDVDRLDYLIRDAFITGFETVNIDYRRLLDAVTIVYHNDCLQVAYKKHALSIIENVVYAHDAEKKWIQSHPVVLYEAYIIKHIIMNLNSKLNVKAEDGSICAKLFSEEALSEEGVVLNDGTKVSLLCDDDIIYLYKNMYMDELSKEFLHRNKRRHPLWKSEAEYRGYINVLGGKGTLSDKFDEFVCGITKGEFSDVPSFSVINDEYIRKIEVELAGAQEELAKHARGFQKKSFESIIDGIKGRLIFCKMLREYAEKNGIPFDFIVLKADIFNSNFSKDFLKKTLIDFDDGEDNSVFEIEKVCPTLQAIPESGIMFYIYYRKNSTATLSGVKKFCEDLFLAVAGNKHE